MRATIRYTCRSVIYVRFLDIYIYIYIYKHIYIYENTKFDKKSTVFNLLTTDVQICNPVYTSDDGRSRLAAIPLAATLRCAL